MKETMKGATSRRITGGKTSPKRPRGAAEGTERLEEIASIPSIPSFARNTRFVTVRHARRAPRAYRGRARVIMHASLVARERWVGRVWPENPAAQ